MGFTYVFVNSLPAAEVPGTTNTTVAASTSTTSTTVATSTSSTTTTTLPSDVAVFLTSVDTWSDDATTLITDARTINQSWDDRTVGLSVISDELDRIAAETRSLSADITAATPPADLTAEWDSVVGAADALADSADAMVAGLAAPDTGEARRSALASFEEAGNTLTTAVAAFRSAAAALGA